MPRDTLIRKRRREENESEENMPRDVKKTRVDCDSQPKKLSHSDFAVGWLCALPKEQTAARAMLDHELSYDLEIPPGDHNTYTLGSIGKHNIVIACLPKGKVGTSAAAACAAQMATSFPSITVGLMVGIGGGVPPKVRLGDIVVSSPIDQYPGVVQWDFGTEEKEGTFRRTGALNNPPNVLLTALSKVESNHALHGPRIPHYMNELKRNWPRLVPSYTWSETRNDPFSDTHAPNCSKENVSVHYGLIASGNQVIKDAGVRDRINQMLGGNVLCFEMEAAGLLDFPCIVIRGISDYADSTKNKDWQEYAAAVAAAFAKEFLGYIQPSHLQAEKQMKDILSQIHDQTSATLRDIAHIKSRQERGDDFKILDWLTSVNYATRQADYFNMVQPGTGGWFINSTQFQSWLATPNQTLFCPGIPGAGKTTLTAIVVHHLSLELRYKNYGLAYIYCDHQRQSEQDPERLLASVLQQLSQCLPCITESLKRLYSVHELKKTRPSLSEILATHDSMAASFERTFVVIDALDECQTSKAVLTRFFDSLCQLQKKYNLNLFVTSRFVPHIMEHFNTCPSLEIRANKEDITRYINGHLGELPNHTRNNKQLQEEINTTITEAADGMFLLAQIYVKLLEDKITPNQVRECLDTLKNQPAQGEDQKVELLNQAYNSTMKRINAQMSGLKDLALDVLLWVTLAKRPIKILELQHALATKSGNSNIDQGDIPQVGDMVSVCSGLVTLDEMSGIIRLVHYTAEGFLKKTINSWYPLAESALTETCISYLSFTVFENGADGGDCQTLIQRIEHYPFYDYAAKYWGIHGTKATESDHLIMNFLQSNAGARAPAELVWRSHDHRRFSLISTANDMGLHMATIFGLSKAVTFFLRLKFSPNMKDDEGRTPLWYAAWGGHREIVNRLLKGNADVNASDASGYSVLHEATSGGYIEIVERLLAAGANVHAVNQYGDTVLHTAASGGCLDVLERLLKAGADVHAADKFRDTALHKAASRGYLEVVERLLAAGADVYAADEYGDTVLHAAVSGGHLEVVEKLLKAGANVHATNTHGDTVLHTAAFGGHSEVVERLLEAGADVHAADQHGDTILHTAVCGGYLEVVESLLAAEADVQAANKDGDTILYIAAFGGYLDIVKRLLAAGADVHAVDKYGDTVLHMAAFGGHLELAEMVLAAGANAHAANNDGDTILYTAAFGGYLDIVNRLLEVGADVNAANKNGDTILHTAAIGGYWEVVEALLSAGADNSAGDAEMCKLLRGEPI